MSAKVDSPTMIAGQLLSEGVLKTRIVAFGIRRRRDTYPLSMTRAATSSILIEESLLAVYSYLPKAALGTEGSVCTGPIVQRKDQRSAYLP